MKKWEVKFKRQMEQNVVDIVEAETMEEAIAKSKDGNVDDSDDGDDGVVIHEFGHLVKEIQ